MGAPKKGQLSKRLARLSRRLKQQQHIRPTRPSSFPLSAHILESFLENPPPGFSEKAKKKVVKVYNRLTLPRTAGPQKRQRDGYYLDDE